MAAAIAGQSGRRPAGARAATPSGMGTSKNSSGRSSKRASSSTSRDTSSRLPRNSGGASAALVLSDLDRAGSQMPGAFSAKSWCVRSAAR